MAQFSVKIISLTGSVLGENQHSTQASRPKHSPENEYERQEAADRNMTLRSICTDACSQTQRKVQGRTIGTTTASATAP